MFGSNGGTVYILGGTGAISAAVETAVQSLGGQGTPYTTVRLKGTNRYGTAVAIAQAIRPDPNIIFVTTGLNFPDAVAADAAAGSFNRSGVTATTNAAVVLLSADSTLPAETKTFIDGNRGHTAELWGTGDQNGDALFHNGYSAFEIAGTNRYETADAVARTFFTSWARGSIDTRATGIATRTNWPDALAGGTLMGTLNGPLLLAQPAGVIPATATFPSAESAAVQRGAHLRRDGRGLGHHPE